MKLIDENTVQLTNKKTGEAVKLPIAELTKFGFTQDGIKSAQNMYKYGNSKPSITQTAVEMLPGVFAGVGAFGGQAAIPIPGVGAGAGAAAGFAGGAAARDILRPIVGTKTPSASNPMEAMGKIGQTGGEALSTGIKYGAVDLIYKTLFTNDVASGFANKTTSAAKAGEANAIPASNFETRLRTEIPAKYGQGANKYVNQAMTDIVQPNYSPPSSAGGELGAGTVETFPKDIVAESQITPEGLLNIRRDVYNVGYSPDTSSLQRLVNQDVARIASEELHTAVPEAQLYDSAYHLIKGTQGVTKTIGGYSARAAIRYTLLYPLLRNLLQ